MNIKYYILISALYINSVHAMDAEKQNENNKVPRVKNMSVHMRNMALQATYYNLTSNWLPSAKVRENDNTLSEKIRRAS